MRSIADSAATSTRALAQAALTTVMVTNGAVAPPAGRKVTVRTCGCLSNHSGEYAEGEDFRSQHKKTYPHRLAVCGIKADIKLESLNALWVMAEVLGRKPALIQPLPEGTRTLFTRFKESFHEPFHIIPPSSVSLTVHQGMITQW